MGIALLAASTLTHPLTALHRWWSRQRPTPGQRATPAAELFTPPPAPPTPDAEYRPAPCMPVPHAHAMAGTACPARPSEPARRQAARPVRATSPAGGPIRMLRSHTSTCGRMVISGRMADVCAELERLAASELLH